MQLSSVPQNRVRAAAALVVSGIHDPCTTNCGRGGGAKGGVQALCKISLPECSNGTIFVRESQRRKRDCEHPDSSKHYVVRFVIILNEDT